MKPKKLILKLAALALGLAALHVAATPAKAVFCPGYAVTCDNGNGGGYCGYKIGQDCTACYGIFDDSVTYGTPCPNPS